MSKEIIRKKFLNRSERNAGIKTPCQIIMEGKAPLLERPSDMDYFIYRGIRYAQSRLEKRLFSKRPNLEILKLMGKHFI